jgi:class 3 adenylate cyclase
VPADRTFAFIDLCGFTAFTQQFGEDAAVRELSRLRAVLRSAAECHGVQIAKWLGDGAMVAAFDPRALAACVMEVRAAVDRSGRLPVRAGVARGPSILFEDEDHVGAAVKLASRLCARAAPDQVLATSEVAAVVSDATALRPLSAIRVPGFDRPVEVRELAVEPSARRLGRGRPGRMSARAQLIGLTAR